MSTIVKGLSQRVLKKIAEYQFPESRNIIAAYSGGPDSAALLHILAHSPYASRTSALYLDHALRPQEEMHQERSLVEQFCSMIGVPLHITELGEDSVRTLAQEIGQGTEAAARELRYQAFKHKAEELGGAAVLTAHTLDDQAETMIMRVFQGSSLEGLAGIPEVRDLYYRPMLHETKAALLAYIADHQIPTWTDSTNERDLFTRNQVRLIIKHIEAVYPGYRKALETLRTKVLWALESLESREDFCLHTVRSEGLGCAEFSLSWFFSLQPYTRMQVLYRIWGEYIAGVKDEQLSFDSIRPFLEYCMGGIPVDSAFCAEGSTITVRSGTVLWSRGVAHNRKKRYLKSVQCDITPLYDTLSLRICTDKYLQPGTAGLIREELAEPLLVRSALPGDAMATPQGTKDLSALFSDWKVPPYKRWMIPVLEDRRGVQAVLGAYFGYSDRVSAVHTRVLQHHEQYVLCSIIGKGVGIPI